MGRSDETKTWTPTSDRTLPKRKAAANAVPDAGNDCGAGADDSDDGGDDAASAAAGVADVRESRPTRW